MPKKIAKKKVTVKKKVKKNSQAKVKKKVKKKEVVKVKKKRGRPPKPKTETEMEMEGLPKVPKKRGRPAGQKNKTYKPRNISSTECDDEYVPPKTYKFLGYCPNKDCNALVGSMDLVAKTIYVCSMCGKRAKVSSLKQELERDRPSSKREYMQSNIPKTEEAWE